MTVVVDASAIVPLALDGEDATKAQEVLRAIISQGGLAPMLFWYEIRNVMVANERRGRSSVERSSQFLDDIAKLPLRLDRFPDSMGVLALARKYGLTVYDAAYLELTLRTHSRLASHDKLLRAAVLAEGGVLLHP